jgi:hypothetical protein
MHLVRRFVGATGIIALLGAAGMLVIAAPTLTGFWTAGGLDAGTTGSGQAARMAVDPFGNVAVVSGPSNGADLAVTSYTSDGEFRWRSAISPSIGAFTGDWVAAAPDGDLVAVGHTITSRGNPIAITIVRYASDGTLLWRVDLARTAPSVGRLIVDAAGSAYLAFNSVGDGQDIQLHKYSASGQLLWSQAISTGLMANDIASSIALSPDGADVVLAGRISGGATWITAAYNATSGQRRWLATAAEGLGARDVVIDASRVYVTGQGVTGAGTPQLAYWLTVIAYDRFTGKRLWRTDTKPDDAANAAGLWISLAPDGSLVATGQAQRGFLDWYSVAFETFGAIRWRAVRDGGLNTDEVPRALLVLDDGTTVVTGPGGPNLPGGFIPGVTAGYDSDGTLVWEAFSRMATVWANALPNGAVCATGGYDALITCWRTPGAAGRAPDAPAGLSAAALSRTSIQLTWTNGTVSQSDVMIERCQGSACTGFVQIGTAPGTATSFTDIGLARRTTYTYRVRARNVFGESPYSNTATGRTKG